MKNKFMLVALIGVILVGALVMVSCGLGCIGDGKCGAEKDKANSLSWCASSISASNLREDTQKAADCLQDLNEQLGKKNKASCTC